MSLLGDIRHAFRMYRETPGLTLVALGSIAITIGATAVVFAAVKTVLLAPLPYSRPEQLVELRTDFSRFAKSKANWVFWPDMQDVRERSRTFEAVATYNYALFNLTGDGGAPPEALYGASVSANLFPLLGVTPMLGRNILPEEDQPGHDHEMILSYGLWTRRFNSDRGIVGRTVEVNGHPCTIIGVMPAGFDFPMRMATTVRTPSAHMDFWTPHAVDPSKVSRSSPAVGGIARLRPGVTIEQAEQDLSAISAALALEYPSTNQGRSLHAELLEARTFGFARSGLWLLFGSALVFLAIGCANVANILLARAFARQREISVRLALGAGRDHIVRQLIAESCLLALAGGLAGYALTWIAWKLLPAIAPATIPRLAASRADWQVLAFAVAIAVLNGVLFGLAPAFRASASDPALALKESSSRGVVGNSRHGFRFALVAGEVSLAVTLVIVGGLLVANFLRLLATDPGFDSGRVLASIIIASNDQYRTSDSREPLFRKIVDAVRALPGVEYAGTVSALPFSGEDDAGLAGSTGPEQGRIGKVAAEIDQTSPDYLRALGVRLLDGRWLSDDDLDAGRDTAIINDTMAQRLWPHESAVGKRVCLYCTNAKDAQWRRVVGVVSTIRHASLSEQALAEAYYAEHAYGHAQFLVVRSTHPTAELDQAVRVAVASVDPRQPVFMSGTLARFIGDSVADRRFIMTLLAVTGLLALLLAAAGVYGVIAYAASLRTQEIGVRMALGASPHSVQALIFRQGMLPAAVGVAVGLAAALVMIRVLHSAIEGLSSADPTLIAAALALVLATSALACWIPARRATRIDPMLALRED